MSLDSRHEPRGSSQIPVWCGGRGVGAIKGVTKMGWSLHGVVWWSQNCDLLGREGILKSAGMHYVHKLWQVMQMAILPNSRNLPPSLARSLDKITQTYASFSNNHGHIETTMKNRFVLA